MNLNTANAAVILVGGKGTRLRPLIADVPKPLAPIKDEPFLYLLLRELAGVGIHNVILLTGYMHDKIVEACGDGSKFGLSIIYSQETEPLGTAGALKLAEPHLKNYHDFLLLNGDSYLESAIQKVNDFSLMAEDIGLIGVVELADASRFGTVEYEVNTNHINTFREKAHTARGYVNVGVYKLSKKIFDFISAEKFTSLETDVFPYLIKNNKSLKAVFCKGKLHDIGLPESYLQFNNENMNKES